MKTKNLIIGAGPVGLACALFLRRSGEAVRIIDSLHAHSTYSKALAVNPRTLELLESTGVTEKMITLGLKIMGARIWLESGKLAGSFEISNLPIRYPFMLALSQSVTERLLREALSKTGTEIERGKSAVSCTSDSTLTETHLDDGETIQSDFVFAADGAHSFLRKVVTPEFSGSSFPDPWYLADVRLKTDLSPQHAHIILLDRGGFYFLVRVVEDARAETEGDPLWRVMSSRPDPLKDFPRGTASAQPVWESNFHISHRIAGSLRKGDIFLAGDAAHLHSPAGARGMNLGIEDAWVFNELLKKKEIDAYAERRRSVDRKVVLRVNLVSRLLLGKPRFLSVLRKHLVPIALKFPPIRNSIARTMLGLDHEI